MKEGKTYAVIGGYGGIGSEVCRLLAAEGASVALGTRSSHDEKPDLGSKRFEVDAENWDEVDAFFDEVVDHFGSLDGAVLCVGSILLKPAHLTSRKEFDDTISKNLSSAFAVTRSACKRMMKTGGSLVLISSGAARHGYPNHEAISAAKAGIIGLGLSAAASYASYGIRVNCVAPGLVDTPLSERITGNEQSLKASKAMHALGRIGRPEEVARSIVWLLDEDQSWITGQTLGVDGGLATLHSKKG